MAEDTISQTYVVSEKDGYYSIDVPFCAPPFRWKLVDAVVKSQALFFGFDSSCVITVVDSEIAGKLCHLLDDNGYSGNSL